MFLEFLEYRGENIAKLAIYEEHQEGWKRFYINILPTRPFFEEKAWAFVFEKLAAYLQENSLHILQGKIYAMCSQREAIAYAFAQALGAATATTFIEGAPCGGGIFGGVQLIAVLCGSQARFAPLCHAGIEVGAYLENNFGRELFISGISGVEEGKHCPGKGSPTLAFPTLETEGLFPSHAAQVQNMFNNAQAILQAHGASFRNVLRTWIYLPHILEWYGLFNRGRNEFYRKEGLLAMQQARVPASTGIQGSRREGEECFMDLLAFMGKDGDKAPWSRLSSPYQNEAYEYKSAFARAVSVDYKSVELVYLSGTASLDRNGQTCYYGDEQGQILHTLTCIAGLLEQRQLSLENLCQATVYCKNERVYGEFTKLVRYFRLEGIPFLPIYADICRNELLFEIDGIAFKTKTKR